MTKRMDECCIDKIRNELIPAISSFSDEYQSSMIGGNDLHVKCFVHCVQKLSQNKHEGYINKCINFVHYTKLYLDEAIWNKIIVKQYKLQGYTYYHGENLLDTLRLINDNYKLNIDHYKCKMEWKLHKIMELYHYLSDYNLLMNEHLIKLETGIVVQLKDYEKVIEEFIEKKIEEEIERDILKTATELL